MKKSLAALAVVTFVLVLAPNALGLMHCIGCYGPEDPRTCRANCNGEQISGCFNWYQSECWEIYLWAPKSSEETFLEALAAQATTSEPVETVEGVGEVAR